MPSIVPSSRSQVEIHGLDGSSSIAYNSFSHSATTTIIETSNTIRSPNQPQHQPKAKNQKIQRTAARNARKIKAKLESANTPAVNRARRLRKHYPEMQGIPDSISVKAKKKLVAEFQNKHYKADAPNSDIAPRNDATAKPSRTRRKTSNNNTGGTSTADPITID